MESLIWDYNSQFLEPQLPQVNFQTNGHPYGGHLEKALQKKCLDQILESKYIGKCTLRSVITISDFSEPLLIDFPNPRKPCWAQLKSTRKQISKFELTLACPRMLGIVVLVLGLQFPIFQGLPLSFPELCRKFPRSIKKGLSRTWKK